MRDMGVFDTPDEPGILHALPGKTCPECGNPTMIHRDGCDFCTACGYVGSADDDCQRCAAGFQCSGSELR